MFQCRECVRDHSTLLDDLNSTESSKNLWGILQLLYKWHWQNYTALVWFIDKAKWMKLLPNKMYYFNTLRPYANMKLHSPKRMFHRIQKFPVLYLQVNIHTLQKILTYFILKKTQKFKYPQVKIQEIFLFTMLGELKGTRLYENTQVVMANVPQELWYNSSYDVSALMYSYTDLLRTTVPTVQLLAKGTWPANHLPRTNPGLSCCWLTCFCTPRRRACPSTTEAFLGNRPFPTAALCRQTLNPACRTAKAVSSVRFGYVKEIPASAFTFAVTYNKHVV